VEQANFVSIEPNQFHASSPPFADQYASSPPAQPQQQFVRQPIIIQQQAPPPPYHPHPHTPVAIPLETFCACAAIRKHQADLFCEKCGKQF
jgi:hypothetical protein